MCGNGVRCVAKYTYEHKLAKAGEPIAVPGQLPFSTSLNIETRSGIITVGLAIDNNDKVQKACVNMGQPILATKDIPVNLPAKEVIEQPMQFLNRAFVMTCVSMGNPHAVFFCDDASLIELEKFGSDTFDLLLHDRTRIIGFHHRSEPFGGRDGHQPGHTGPWVYLLQH